MIDTIITHWREILAYVILIGAWIIMCGPCYFCKKKKEPEYDEYS